MHITRYDTKFVASATSEKQGRVITYEEVAFPFPLSRTAAFRYRTTPSGFPSSCLCYYYFFRNPIPMVTSHARFFFPPHHPCPASHLTNICHPNNIRTPKPAFLTSSLGRWFSARFFSSLTLGLGCRRAAGGLQVCPSNIAGRGPLFCAGVPRIKGLVVTAELQIGKPGTLPWQQFHPFRIALLNCWYRKSPRFRWFQAASTEIRGLCVVVDGIQIIS